MSKKPLISGKKHSVLFIFTFDFRFGKIGASGQNDCDTEARLPIRAAWRIVKRCSIKLYHSAGLGGKRFDRRCIKLAVFYIGCGCNEKNHIVRRNVQLAVAMIFEAV